MHSFPVNPVAPFVELRRHRGLISALIRREVVGRYRGSFLGLLWSFLHPALMLAVYTVVFGVVFEARWGAHGQQPLAHFALALFSGLIVFNLFAECASRAPSLVLSQPSFVKKVVFPLEVLAPVAVGSALCHTLVATAIWLAGHVLVVGLPSPRLLLLPLLLFPMALLTLGVTWFAAALGVYVRDLSQIMSVLVSALMFVSPVFFPLSSLPEAFRPVLALNPLAAPVEQCRALMMWGELPDATRFAMQTGVSMCIAWLGFAWFQKTRKGFADVI